MRDYEVGQPILNSPYEEPRRHWVIREGEPPEQREARRPAMYFYRDPKPRPDGERDEVGTAIELLLVRRIRERLAAWRKEGGGYAGVTRTTRELVDWWRRDGRQHRLFFAQIEAAETIIFLKEARPDLLQGISIPPDEPGADAAEKGYSAFTRYACKMATGAGKTTVMGMLAAWSILNKVANRGDRRFSDLVLVVCPNVTIRQRLEELKPERGGASLYAKRDLVPAHLLPQLARGRVVVTNWHTFELQTPQGGDGARVVKAGVPEVRTEVVNIGAKSTTARGSRYMTIEAFEALRASGAIDVLDEEREQDGSLRRVRIRSTRYVESDQAMVARVLGREVGGKQNALVINDEAHHAYRIRKEEPEEGEDEAIDEEAAESYFREATVWIEGLDRIHKLRGINFCVDLSATPYFLGRVGQETNRPFPWVVSDFGLIEAIESGLTKIPQLAARDTTGAAVPGYFNVWKWIVDQLSPSERGGKRASPKPEAILKYAQTPITMLGGMWEAEAKRWAQDGGDQRPPVFILVCKNTQIARVIHEWLAEGKTPAGVAPCKVESFRNREGMMSTIRVDTKVVDETDSGIAKDDEMRWMRFVLDTVGKSAWPKDPLGGPLLPEGFAELCDKLGRPKDPLPGHGVRCIVSVGMLTEGWDCSTVTHIVGLRPFTSQLLCEQVVGRALRRRDYEVGEDGLFSEEIAQVFGVPFQVAPFKAQKQAAPKTRDQRHHVYAVPGKVRFEIRFPRVEGYSQAIRNRIAVDWDGLPALTLEPGRIPTEVEMKASLPTNSGKPALSGPGRVSDVNLHEFRKSKRLGELEFDLASALTRHCVEQGRCQVPAHRLFPQALAIVKRFLAEKVVVKHPADKKDIFLSPYYGWAVERLAGALRPDAEAGEAAEVPIYEHSRGAGSTAEVDYWTSRDVREAVRSHLNYVVADTARWEQQAATFIDRHDGVDAFVKNAGLGFAIPYLHDGQTHDYVPDFIVRLRDQQSTHLILETKGYDPVAEVKKAAAERWVGAVNADARHGRWAYAMVKDPAAVPPAIERYLT